MNTASKESHAEDLQATQRLAQARPADLHLQGQFALGRQMIAGPQIGEQSGELADHKIDDIHCAGVTVGVEDGQGVAIDRDGERLGRGELETNVIGCAQRDRATRAQHLVDQGHLALLVERGACAGERRKTPRPRCQRRRITPRRVR